MRHASYRVPRRVTIERTDVAAWVVQPAAHAMPLMAQAPRLSSESRAAVREFRIVDDQGEHRSIQVPDERPLTVVLEGREIVTLMTLGASPELLVLGFLRNQRLIDAAAELESITVDWQAGTAVVTRRAGSATGTSVNADVRAVPGTGCGLGTSFPELMARVDSTSLPPAAGARISRSVLLSLLETMRQHDAVHRAAGSVHSCALFYGAGLWVSVEDVSRHNGIDTITGWMALHGVPGGNKILFTTGRLTGEMVMKAAHNGVPILVSRNGVTAMGCDIAAKLGMTLFGRAVNRRFLCYVGAERFDAEPSPG